MGTAVPLQSEIFISDFVLVPTDRTLLGRQIFLPIISRKTDRIINFTIGNPDNLMSLKV